jgi:hypothetical protein
MLICVHWRYGTPKSAISHIMWLGISCSNRFLNENGEYGYRNTHHSELFPPFTTGFFWYIIWEWVKTIKKTYTSQKQHTISSIYHPSVYNIIYQNWLHLHTSPFLSTLERPDADAKCWRDYPPSRACFSAKKLLRPIPCRLPYCLATAGMIKKTAWNINESTS